MSGVFFTSDPHFQHKRVAELRGFDTVEAHDRYLIDAWNAVVRPDDTVWVLGDVTLGSIHDVGGILEDLNGQKHLITGNHDACWPGHRNAHKAQVYYLQYFRSVQSFARMKYEGEDFLLSHFPYSGDHTDTERYSQYRLRDEGLHLLHGHVHAAWRHRERMTNVGMDAWDYAPVHQRTLMQDIKAERILEHMRWIDNHPLKLE